jgi:hypothetical protein
MDEEQNTVCYFSPIQELVLRVTYSAIPKDFVGKEYIQVCIEKFPDWPPGARTANGTALCHYLQLYRYFVSQSSEFCRHNLLCFFSTSVCCCCRRRRRRRYRFNPETFGYTLVYRYKNTIENVESFEVSWRNEPFDVWNKYLSKYFVILTFHAPFDM